MILTLSDVERRAFLAGFGVSNHAAWRATALPHQQPPDRQWQIWLLIAGRGAGRDRSLSTAERDAQCARLRAEGMSYQVIADRLGFTDRSTARQACQRALQAVVQEPAEELRKLELERLDRMYQAALKVLRTPHRMVQHGKIVRDEDGVPVVDDAPVLAAIDRLLSIQTRRARLLGLDGAEKVEITYGDLNLDAELDSFEPPQV